MSSLLENFCQHLTWLCFNVLLSLSVIWLVLKYKLFPASSQKAFNIWSPWILCPLIFFSWWNHPSSDFFVGDISQISDHSHSLLWTLLKAAVSFLKSDFLMGSLPACSWAARSLPYLTRKLLSAQLPTAQPSGTQICFWFSFPQFWGRKKRFSLIQNQAPVLCCLFLPSGTFKVLQELLKRERGSWMLSFGGEWNPRFFCVHETHLIPRNFSLSLSLFLPVWKPPKNCNV